MSYHALVRVIAWFSLVVFAVACGKTSPIADREGNTVYTQIGMWVEEGGHNTTNYSQGLHLPVNTQVEIRDSNDRAIVFYVPELDEEVRLSNAEQYTRLDIAGIYDRYFGTGTVDLGGFDSNARQAIERGEVKPGMSKEAVLLARGYPPAHETPSTERDSWTYWRHRFGRRMVHFENGRVSEIE